MMSSTTSRSNLDSGLSGVQVNEREIVTLEVLVKLRKGDDLSYQEFLSFVKFIIHYLTN